MANRRIYPFGVHSIQIKNYTSGLPLYYGEVLAQANYAPNKSTAEVMGGSNLYPRHSFVTERSPEFSITFKEFPAEVAGALKGALVTNVASSTEYSVGTPVKVKGDWTGVSFVKLISATKQIPGRYTLVATSASVVDVFLAPNAGEKVTFVDNTTAKYVASLTVDETNNVQIGTSGVEISADQVPAFAVGDAIYFDVTPPHEGGIIVSQDNSSDTNEELSILLKGDNGGAGYRDLEIYRAVCTSDLPEPFNVKEASEFEVTFKLLWSDVHNAVLREPVYRT